MGMCLQQPEILLGHDSAQPWGLYWNKRALCSGKSTALEVTPSSTWADEQSGFPMKIMEFSPPEPHGKDLPPLLQKQLPTSSIPGEQRWFSADPAQDTALQAGDFFPPAQPLIKVVPTCQVEGKGDEAMVFAEDPQGLLPLHQGEEIICHRLTIEEIVHTQQEVPGEGGNLVSMSPKRLLK